MVEMDEDIRKWINSISHIIQHPIVFNLHSML
jgi:hypothetical protein